MTEEEDRELTADEAYDVLLQKGIASEETLSVVSSINGHKLETYEVVLYAVTGLNSFDQLEDSGW